MDMTGKTVVVTGANSGIGFETAAALARAGAKVVVTCRNEPKGREALDRLRREGDAELVAFDLSENESVHQGAERLLELCPRLDVLVNNAGLVLGDRRTNSAGLEMTFATNHLGPFLLTNLLLERLLASAPARIVNVSSTAHNTARRGLDFDDLQSTRRYRGMDVYGKTKLANILFTFELARRLDPARVTANALHPGTVNTGFAKDGDTKLLVLGAAIARPFMLTSAKGAATSIYLASSPDVAGVTGGYFVRCRQRTPSRAARDEQAARRLWEVSEQLTGLAPSAAA